MLLAISLPAAGNEPASKETAYLNWWGPYRVNIHNWKKASVADLDDVGLYEISVYPPETEPTPQQSKAADELIVDTFAAAMRHNWFDFRQARKDGYVPYDSAHYVNQRFVDDGRTLDPDRPETLMCYPTENGMRLVGVMYLMPTNAQHGPQIGGPLTRWHFHLASFPHCWFDYPDFTPNPDGSCKRKERARRSPEMLHVWIMDHPEGPFASNMDPPKYIQDMFGPPQCLAAP